MGFLQDRNPGRLCSLHIALPSSHSETEFQSLEGKAATLHIEPSLLPPGPMAHSVKTVYSAVRAGSLTFVFLSLPVLVPFTTYYKIEELRTSVCHLWSSPITNREQSLTSHPWLCLLDQGPLTSAFTQIPVVDISWEPPGYFGATE